MILTNASGNEIAKIEGLEGLSELRELVLDRNKVKVYNEKFKYDTDYY